MVVVFVMVTVTGGRVFVVTLVTVLAGSVTVFGETAFLEATYPRTPPRTITAITRPMIAYKPPLDTELLLFFNPTHLCYL